MPPLVADDEQKRRARRRLIGAVALTITAVILVPLVLEDERPPAGPLEVQMPPPAALEQSSRQDIVEQALPPASALAEAEPSQSEPLKQGEQADKESELPATQTAPKSIAPPQKETSETPAATVFTVQVGVFADIANVEKLETRIAGLGLESQTDKIEGSTRIRVGVFKSRADAEKVMSKLASAGIPARVVEK